MPRHGENIWKRKDGRWEARYIKSRTADGKAIYGSVYAKSYIDVRRKRDEVLLALALQQIKSSTTTLEAVVSEFLNDKKPKVKLSTYTRYVENSERYIVPALGNIAITD